MTDAERSEATRAVVCAVARMEPEEVVNDLDGTCFYCGGFTSSDPDDCSHGPTCPWSLARKLAALYAEEKT